MSIPAMVVGSANDAPALQCNMPNPKTLQLQSADNATDWTCYYGTCTDYDSSGLDGSGAIKLFTGSNLNKIIIQTNFSSALNLNAFAVSGYFHACVMIPDNNTSASVISFFLYTVDRFNASKSFKYELCATSIYSSNQWWDVNTPLSDFVPQTGDANWQQVTGLAIEVTTKFSTPATILIDDINVVQFTHGPMVVFRMDDFGEDLYTVGLPILDKYGYSAFAVGNTRSEPTEDYTNQFGIMSWSQIDDLYYNHSWDIGSHLTTHIHLDGTQGPISNERIIYELTTSQNDLLARGYTRSYRFLVLPGEATNDTVDQYIKQYYVMQVKWHPGINTMYYPFEDRYHLNYQDTFDGSFTSMVWGAPEGWYSASLLKSMFDRARINNQVFILLMHHINATVLDDFCSYVNSTGVPVVTPNQLFNDPQSLPSKLPTIPIDIAVYNPYGWSTPSYQIINVLDNNESTFAASKSINANQNGVVGETCFNFSAANLSSKILFNVQTNLNVPLNSTYYYHDLSTNTYLPYTSATLNPNCTLALDSSQNVFTDSFKIIVTTSNPCQATLRIYDSKFRLSEATAVSPTKNPTTSPMSVDTSPTNTLNSSPTTCPIPTPTPLIASTAIPSLTPGAFQTPVFKDQNLGLPFEVFLVVFITIILIVVTTLLHKKRNKRL